MSSSLLTAILLILPTHGISATADREDELLKDLYQAVEALVEQHYPDASMHQFGNRIHFEHDTRLFVIPAFTKVPRGQQPPLTEERGPKSAGVYCDIYYEEGPYRGARAEGQFDRGPFDEYYWVPTSDEKDCYLRVILRTPNGEDADIPDGFVDELKTLLAGFEVYFPNEP